MINARKIWFTMTPIYSEENENVNCHVHPPPLDQPPINGADQPSFLSLSHVTKPHTPQVQ